MARAYSDDLRRKLLEAHDQGQASLAELASRFGVSRGWAWKISAARRRSGQVERQRYRPGPDSRLDRKALAGLLAGSPDLTLRRLQAGMEKLTGVRSPRTPIFSWLTWITACTANSVRATWW